MFLDEEELVMVFCFGALVTRPIRVPKIIQPPVSGAHIVVDQSWYDSFKPPTLNQYMEKEIILEFGSRFCLPLQI